MREVGSIPSRGDMIRYLSMSVCIWHFWCVVGFEGGQTGECSFTKVRLWVNEGREYFDNTEKD